MIKTFHDSFALKTPFVLSRGAKTTAEVVRVEITRSGVTGRGESVPYARYGESVESVIAQIKTLPASTTLAQLQTLLPAGAARNAVDCALWDLWAKQTGNSVWQKLGLAKPAPQTTTFTLSLDTPDAMYKQAKAAKQYPILKIKLGAGATDCECLSAVRRAVPEAKLIVDANEGWDANDYIRLLPTLQQTNVWILEQPFPADNDAILTDLPRPICVCADESCHTAKDLVHLIKKYDMVNIKLDKTGGLSAAARLYKSARALDFAIMVGCMVGTSLAMAPAVLLAADCTVADLDAPLLLARDRAAGLSYKGGYVHPPHTNLWGNENE